MKKRHTKKNNQQNSNKKIEINNLKRKNGEKKRNRNFFLLRNSASGFTFDLSLLNKIYFVSVLLFLYNYSKKESEISIIISENREELAELGDFRYFRLPLVLVFPVLTQLNVSFWLLDAYTPACCDWKWQPTRLLPLSSFQLPFCFRKYPEMGRVMPQSWFSRVFLPFSSFPLSLSLKRTSTDLKLFFFLSLTILKKTNKRKTLITNQIIS